AQIYAPKTTVRFSSFSPPWLPENIPGIGRNPLDGVILDYYLKEKADTNLLTLEILDASGKIIRTLTNKRDETFKPYPGGPPPAAVIPAEAGLNRYAWDFRTEGIPGVQGAFVYGDYRGYRVAPGQYKARLNHKGIVSEVSFAVVADPRLSVNPADWTAQQQLLERLTQDIRNMHEAVTNLRKVKKQLEGINEALKGMDKTEAMLQQGENLIKKIDAWEANIVESRQRNFQDVINWPSKLNAEYFDLRGKVDVHDPRITQGVRERLRDLEAQWNTHQAAMRDLLGKDIVAYNQMFREQNIPAVIVK
ncbi:MAG: glycosyl hydrolase, partial [Saprospiraceae bacterium]|nr:glycosyl hydrolase [Saprospiraceae bacterium]